MWITRFVGCYLKGHAFVDITRGRRPYQLCLHCGKIKEPLAVLINQSHNNPKPAEIKQISISRKKIGHYKGKASMVREGYPKTFSKMMRNISEVDLAFKAGNYLKVLATSEYRNMEFIELFENIRASRN